MDSNLSKYLYVALLQASKADRRPEFPSGHVNCVWDVQNKQVTGNFSLPLVEIIDLEDGRLIIDVADFLQSAPDSMTKKQKNQGNNE